MQKMILVDYDKCTGCRYCETVCTVNHEGVCNPSRARIKIMRSEFDAFQAPTLCQQCREAPCIKVCPKEALLRDEEYGMVKIDYDLCIGCRACVLICPFGAMRWDEASAKPTKCDLCDGDPACVKACSTDALQFIDATEANLVKKMEVAAQLMPTAKRFI